MSKGFVTTFLTLATVLAATFVSQAALAACGHVEVAKGDVKVQRASGGEPVVAPKDTKICQGDTIITAAQSRAKVKMEDGNELNISPDSAVKLETYEYKATDNKKKVMLDILHGKVRAATQKENMYNDKAKDGQANTFQVKTKSAVAGVRGTDFLTSFDVKTNKTEVLTFKGVVAVGNVGASGAITNVTMVEAGKRSSVVNGAPPTLPAPVPKQELDKTNSETASRATNHRMIGSAELGTTPETKEPDKRELGDKRDGDRRPASAGDNGPKDDPKRNPDSSSGTVQPPPPPPPPPPPTLPVMAPVLPPTVPTPPPTPPPNVGRVKIEIKAPPGAAQ